MDILGNIVNNNYVTFELDTIDEKTLENISENGLVERVILNYTVIYTMKIFARTYEQKKALLNSLHRNYFVSDTESAKLTLYTSEVEIRQSYFNPLFNIDDISYIKLIYNMKDIKVNFEELAYTITIPLKEVIYLANL